MEEDYGMSCHCARAKLGLLSTDCVHGVCRCNHEANYVGLILQVVHHLLSVSFANNVVISVGTAQRTSMESTQR
jgi:hypothetical protein